MHSALWASPLPREIAYDPAITTPEAYLGFEYGERHIYHHELDGYMQLMAQQSPRVQRIDYGRTHAGRPLFQLLISSEENNARSEEIRTQHLRALDPRLRIRVDLAMQPVVVNLNYSIHGNEPSGGNAALWVAYHLAAAQDAATQELLDMTVLLLDPCLNPDGFAQFAQWVNHNAGRNPSADPQTREHRENWPGSRTNFYHFDLNRDWMLLTQPESQGRLALYHRWLPNYVLDFHEMGTDSTYFFQPGVPARTHPLIPDYVYALTESVAQYYAEALDAVGALYYSKERFDDFYPGKGSTVSDLKGAIGVLFEQASSRGQIQDSVNGPVEFRTTLRNQLVVSLAVLKAARERRVEFLENTRRFYRDAYNDAQEAGFAGYRFAAPGDPQRAAEFAQLLETHAIEVQPLADGSGYWVPLVQAQYRYLEALAELRTEFEQNLFYDITAWSLPLAYNLEWEKLQRAPATADATMDSAAPIPARSALGYLIDWRAQSAPKVVFDLLEAAVRLKYATAPFNYAGLEYSEGTVFVPVSLQPERGAEIHAMVSAAAQADGTPIVAVESFLTPEGIDLGSDRFRLLEIKRILIAAGEGVDPNQSGELWHLFDVRGGHPVSRISPPQLARLDLSAYSAILLPDAAASAYDEAMAEALRAWVRGGGTLICFGRANNWAARHGLSAVEFVAEAQADSDAERKPRRPFATAWDDRALERIRGAIFASEVDKTHPLAFGYRSGTLPVFVEGEGFLQPSKSPYQTPLIFAQAPLLAGYASERNLTQIAGSAAAVVGTQGRGTVIHFAHSPTFRAYWRGTEKLVLNAVLFGSAMRAP